MSYIFCLCDSLVTLPDISKWDTTNTYGIHGCFSGCHSLISLPDISKWNVLNLDYINYNMFIDCKSLISLPDIFKWNNKDFNDKSNFYGCLHILNNFGNN